MYYIKLKKNNHGLYYIYLLYLKTLAIDVPCLQRYFEFQR